MGLGQPEQRYTLSVQLFVLHFIYMAHSVEILLTLLDTLTQIIHIDTHIDTQGCLKSLHGASLDSVEILLTLLDTLTLLSQKDRKIRHIDTQGCL